MIELRCETTLHAKFNPDREVLSIKCKSCTRAEGRPVYHHWPLAEIVDRYHRGEIAGTCAPKEPQFVHWRVEAA